MKQLLATLALAVAAAPVQAQRRHVVADMDTHLPIAGAVVAADNGLRAATDATGHFAMAMPFTSATVSRKYYMQRRVGKAELASDTIWLIPQEVVLSEVVVTTPGRQFDSRAALRSVRENASLPNPSQGFNLLGIIQTLIPSKKQRHAARLEKLKKVLDKY